MLKLDSTVHRLESDIVSESFQHPERGTLKGSFREPGEKWRLSGLARMWPSGQSWHAVWQQLSSKQNFLCADTSANSCGINTQAERTICPPLASNKKVIQGGSTGCVIQVRCSTVAWIWHFTTADFFVFLSRCDYVHIPNTHPAPSAQHASYHITGIYHFQSCGGGVVSQR